MRPGTLADRPAPSSPVPADSSAEPSPVRARLARIQAGRDFPVLSQQIAATISAMDDNAASMQHLTNVVLREYGLTLSVIRAANSSHYRRSDRQIQSVTRAIMLLGARTVRQLASSLLLFANYRRHSAGLKELMLLSLLTANHARNIAIRLGVTDPEELHLCGMCRNLGEVLIACHFPVDYARIHTLIRDGKHREASAALAVLGFRYEDLGEEVCRHWGLPDTVIESLRARATRITSRTGAMTAFAHDLTTIVYRRDADAGDARRDLDALVARYKSSLALDRTQVRDILATALEETRELFVTADVHLDALRMRELSEAACSALGIDSLDADALVDSGESATSAPVLRERLAADLASRADRTTSCDLGQILLLALEAALRGGPFERAVACVLNHDRTRLRARSGLGANVESLLAAFDFPMTPQGGALPAAVLQRKPLAVPAQRPMSTVEQRFAERYGIAQFAVFPLVVDGQAVGCIYADRTDLLVQPDRETLDYVASLTAHVVHAIELRRAAARTSRDRDSAVVVQPQALSAEAKSALVMRLLRGEALGDVARSSGISAETLDKWRTDFMAGALARLTGA